MPRASQFHLDQHDDGLVARHLSKEQLGRRLYRLMIEKGWSQAEFGRRADLPRDRISTYVRGVSYPTPQSLEKLAKALNMAPEELLPNVAETAIATDAKPIVDFRVSEANPNMAWLRVNRLVPYQTAAKIVAMLATESEADDRDKTVDAS